MRIFDEKKEVELSEVDRETGRLVREKLFIAHHEAREAREEVGHYKTVREYPNGGKTVEWVVDEPAVAACAEHDEYEDILVFVPYTEEELIRIAARKEIAELKAKLRETDYKAIKYAEGMITLADYAPIREERQSWRDRIGELEAIAEVGYGS